MNLMSIYNASPIFVQNLMTSVQGYLFKRVRFGKVYEEALREYEERDYSDAAALEEYQWERFAELLRYAVANSPFYKKYYEGIDIEEVIASRDITKLPVLEKETVRQNVADMYTIPPEEGTVSNTSGTTGKSMQFVHTKVDMQRRMAYLDHFKMQNGFIPLKMKRASFNSSKIVPPKSKRKVFWRDNITIKQRIYSGYHCQGENCKYYIENLNKYKPQSMDGYPSAMYELAQYCLTNHIELSFRPIAIFPTAETLLPHYREAIEKAFQCPVYDQYASSEGAPFITGCRSGKLHYCMDTGIIEFGEDGRMLVTSFETHGTPLIRYDIGDKAFLADETCDCGCAMPVVSRIEGRTADFLWSPNFGRITAVYLSLVSSEFSNCMKGMQFIQNDKESVDVNIETDERYQPSMNQIIIDKLHYNIGKDMDIRIHVVDEIPKEPSGKVRFIINNVADK